jgi:acetyl-CoA acyltransferase 1
LTLLSRKVLSKTGLSIEDVDLFEINEAFASMMVYTIEKLQLPLDKLNVNGGAMYVALGRSFFHARC